MRDQIHGSLIPNLVSGLCAADEADDCEMAVICEDDDWYGPEFLEQCCKRLDVYDVISAHFSGMYNAKFRLWRGRNDNRESRTEGRLSGGFCGLVIRGDWVQRVADHLSKINKPTTIDARRMTFNCLDIVSIKGLATNGLTNDHRDGIHRKGWYGDPGGAVLASWVGEDDAAEILEAASR